MHNRGWPAPREFKNDDLAIARRFADSLKAESKSLVKEIIFFGSSARKHSVIEESYARDIDVLVIFDDGVYILTPEVVETYRVITSNIAIKVSDRLHINTMKLSAWWEFAGNGDPIVVNILRDGIPLVGAGIFESMRVLLGQGLISPSKECMWSYFMRSPETLMGARLHILQASVDLYWAVVDSAHGLLLSHSVLPDTPDHALDLLKDLARRGVISKEHISTFEGLHKLNKEIMYRDIKTITGQQYDAYYQKAKAAVIAMQQASRIV